MYAKASPTANNNSPHASRPVALASSAVVPVAQPPRAVAVKPASTPQKGPAAPNPASQPRLIKASSPPPLAKASSSPPLAKAPKPHKAKKAGPKPKATPMPTPELSQTASSAAVAAVPPAEKTAAPVYSLPKIKINPVTQALLQSSRPPFREVLLGESGPQPLVSPYSFRVLKPFIRRDFDALPPRLALLRQLAAVVHWKRTAQSEDSDVEEHPIDYVYLRAKQLDQVNELLCDNFWPGIDVKEWLRWPEYSIVCMYRQKVIGAAFINPEGYLSYIAVREGWRGAGIARFMLYHLIQSCPGKDITLHVSVNNSAMILYQKFGFKPEQFIVDFYHKYLPEDSPHSTHAFSLRLKR